jgi:hypothetical protein
LLSPLLTHGSPLPILSAKHAAQLTATYALWTITILSAAAWTYPFLVSWSVWVCISKQSFDLIVDLWDEDVRSNRDPLFGRLCNSIPVYPQTYSLKTHLHLRDSGIRPFIELEPTDHPLAIEQREGITLQRVEQIAASVHLQ